MPGLAAVLRRAGWGSLGCGPAARAGPALNKRVCVSPATSQAVCVPVPCSRRCFPADSACGRVVFEGRIGATGSGSKPVYVCVCTSGSSSNSRYFPGCVGTLGMAQKS